MVAPDLSLEEVRQINYRADNETGNVWQKIEYGGEVEFGKREKNIC